jgi:hypothetical protein
MDSLSLKMSGLTPNSRDVAVYNRRHIQIICLLVAILKFKMAVFTKLTNSINTAINGYLDPEHMGIETKLKSLCASHTEI